MSVRYNVRHQPAPNRDMNVTLRSLGRHRVEIACRFGPTITGGTGTCTGISIPNLRIFVYPRSLSSSPHQSWRCDRVPVQDVSPSTRSSSSNVSERAHGSVIVTGGNEGNAGG
jgi:hypothetical protein